MYTALVSWRMYGYMQDMVAGPARILEMLVSEIPWYVTLPVIVELLVELFAAVQGHSESVCFVPYARISSESFYIR